MMPTQRTLAALRADGYTAPRQWNAGSRMREGKRLFADQYTRARARWLGKLTHD